MSKIFNSLIVFREIDDIVLDYVVNIVEDVASSNSDADFDVEEFCEMLTAYMPQTSDIAPELIADWMFKLANEMREIERSKGSILISIVILIKKAPRNENQINVTKNPTRR